MRSQKDIAETSCSNTRSESLRSQGHGPFSTTRCPFKDQSPRICPHVSRLNCRKLAAWQGRHSVLFSTALALIFYRAVVDFMLLALIVY